jgi:Thymidylate synthase complementing protein
MPNRSEADRPTMGLEEAPASWRPAADQLSAAQLSDAQQDEVQAMRAQSTPTRRAVVPELEQILYQPLPVLDRGFVRVIDYMGDDAAIVQAARVSYGRGTRKLSDDRGLINYLMRMRHTSPFEMCELKVHVKLPIFVAPVDPAPHRQRPTRAVRSKARPNVEAACAQRFRFTDGRRSALARGLRVRCRASFGRTF